MVHVRDIPRLALQIACGVRPSASHEVFVYVAHSWSFEKAAWAASIVVKHEQHYSCIGTLS
eukprot:4305829-Alexandrium_andersonii.AAC.1